MKVKNVILELQQCDPEADVLMEVSRDETISTHYIGSVDIITEGRNNIVWLCQAIG